MEQLEEELKALLIEALNLEELDIKELDSHQTLFGEGLGLDSIDALELGVAIQKRYDIKIKANSEENNQHFLNIHNLALYIKDQTGA